MYFFYRTDCCLLHRPRPQVSFNKEVTVTEEVSLQHNTDVSLTVIEPLTGER